MASESEDLAGEREVLAIFLVVPPYLFSFSALLKHSLRPTDPFTRAR